MTLSCWVNAANAVSSDVTGIIYGTKKRDFPKKSENSKKKVEKKQDFCKPAQAILIIEPT